MSTLARWLEARAVLNLVDPLLAPGLLASWDALDRTAQIPLVMHGHVVLVGHRAAGKSTLLPAISQLVRRAAVDLDAEIERRAGMPVADIFRRGETEFRTLERTVFGSLSGQKVVAAGGGFLSNHADLLTPHLAVLVPISLQTYRQRLMAIPRPRLRPSISLDEEITQVYAQRDLVHASVPTMPLLEFLARQGSMP